MKQPRVASRYAKSLLSLSQEKNSLEAVLADMKAIVSLCDKNRDLELLLQSPVVKADKKQSILNAVFAGQLGEISNSFIQLMTAKRREHLLVETAESFIAQYRTLKNIVSAEVRSAVKLDENIRKQIIEKLTKDAASVELVEVIDPELIGGFVVRVGDMQIDASVASDIRDLKQTFKSNSYIANF